METMPELRQNKNPFAENLTNSNISEVHLNSGKLNELKGNPNIVIRTEHFDELNERYGEKIEVTELLRITKKLYEELGTKYGIRVPVSFFIGEKDGNKVVYSVVDKIEQKNIADTENPQEVIAQFDELYASVSKYFVDKFMSGEMYLCDINNPSQYVYGKKQGAQKDEIYLVDTDLYVGNSKFGIYLIVEWLARHLSGVEKNFKMKFENARMTLGQFINQPIPQGATDAEKIEAARSIGEINKFLNNEKFGPAPKFAIPQFE